MRRDTPGTEEREPDRRAGSYAFCRSRNSSSDMISSPSFSRPSIDDGDGLDAGGRYVYMVGCGVWRIAGMGVGRVRPLEDVENCEVLEVERVWRWRPLTGLKVTSDMERE